MRGKAQEDDQRWALKRAPAYSNALRAAAKPKFRNVYRHILEAERLVLATEGNPPGVITQDVVSATSTEMVEEASLLDAEYDAENFEHHAPRVRCFFYKRILVCFTVCEVNDLITMTCFKLPEETHVDPDAVSSSEFLVTPNAPHSGFVMELNPQTGDVPSPYYCSGRGWNAPALNKQLSRLLLQHVEVSNTTVSRCDLWQLKPSAKSESTLSKCVWQDSAPTAPRYVRTLCHSALDASLNRTVSIRALKGFKIYMLLFRK